MSSTDAVEHSVFADPAFAKMSDLKHAQSCARNVCSNPDCGELKFLLKHVARCKKEQCKYKDCNLSRVLLDHSNGDHTFAAAQFMHCPLCKKSEIIRRLHPGKGPRDSTSDDEEDEKKKMKNDEDEVEKEEKDTEDKKKDTKDIEIVQAAHRLLELPIARRDLRPARPQQLHPKKLRMMQLIHSENCRKVACIFPHCSYTKILLYHISDCAGYLNECAGYQCFYPGCFLACELMRHYHGCKPFNEQCLICDKKPVPVYTGDDRLSAMPDLVLRTIIQQMGVKTTRLHTLSLVNRRFAHYLRNEKELRCLCTEVEGPQHSRNFFSLVIEQVGDKGEVCFHFEAEYHGVFHVMTTVGTLEYETICFNQKKNEKAKKYIAEKYPSCPTSKEPVRIPAELYTELTLAMIRDRFLAIELKSVYIDNFFLEFFVDRMSDIYAVPRELTITNVKFDPNEQLDKSLMKDFMDVLDVEKVVHKCENMSDKKKVTKKRKSKPLKKRKQVKKKDEEGPKCSCFLFEDDSEPAAKKPNSDDSKLRTGSEPAAKKAKQDEVSEE